MTAPALDVLIVGGGPAGLAAAVALRRRADWRVLVVDREAELGGVPRHCDHLGFGLLDLRRILSGPSYARRRVALARAAGVELAAESTALAWPAPTRLRIGSPAGVAELDARAVLLATGCRERPRAARLVPGTRPHGVLTTGSLQQLVARGIRPGRRAVVVGAEHVSFSAVHTLRAAGAEVAAIVTDLPRHQSFGLFRWLVARRVPLWTSSTVTAIAGAARVDAVELATPEGAQRIACDTVVFTGDWIPDHELARLGGLAIDPRSRGPRVDAALRTSARGVFAAGNLLRGAAPADVAALEGRAAAAAIHDFLDGGAWPDHPPVPIHAEPPLRWIFPSAVADASPPPRGRFLAGVTAFVDRATLELRQGDRLLHTERYRRLVPNRLVSVPTRWLGDVRPGPEPVVATVRAG